MSHSRRDVLLQFALAASGSIAARLVSAGGLKPSALAGVKSAPVLGATQRAMVATLAEMIIPETDTPGAIKAGVPQFIEQILGDWYTPQERAIFLDGLAALDSACRQQFGTDFLACTGAQRVAVLGAAEATSLLYRNAHANPSMGIQDEPDAQSPFFFKLKELTVLGFYTSEVGSTTELSYNPVPGHYDGDYTFDQVGHQWSW